MSIQVAVVSVVVTLFFYVAPLFAQQPTTAQEFDWSLGAVYDIALNEGRDSSNVGLHIDVARRFLGDRALSAAAVGEVGFNHFESLTRSQYMGGLRFSGGDHRKYTPFGQVLLGAEHCCRAIGTNFAVQTGGGFDVTWRPRAALRIQADWRHVFTDVGDDDGFRAGVGLVIPLNR